MLLSVADPLVLYSANTWLAYIVAEHFYGGEHYVWCTPDFGTQTQAAIDQVAPPSSSPAEIYRSLHEDSRRGDRHSAKVNENKAGILRGAAIKRAGGVISDSQQHEIGSILEQASGRDFRPLLYVIPFHAVRSLAQRVPVAQRAHPLAREYIVESLRRDLFDVLELPMGGN
jgi:hypothetical protein